MVLHISNINSPPSICLSTPQHKHAASRQPTIGKNIAQLGHHIQKTTSLPFSTCPHYTFTTIQVQIYLLTYTQLLASIHQKTKLGHHIYIHTSPNHSTKTQNQYPTIPIPVPFPICTHHRPHNRLLTKNHN